MNGELFCSIRPEEMEGNPFQLIGKDWMLLTAALPDGRVNMMTANWGGMGVMWGKNVFSCVIRPQRYTLPFAEESGRISLCFFEEEYRDVLRFCGAHSGRDCDKLAQTGLTVCRNERGAVWFAQAKLALLGRIIYRDVIRPEGFLDSDIPAHAYPGGDYHRRFVCEVEEILRHVKAEK